MIEYLLALFLILVLVALFSYKGRVEELSKKLSSLETNLQQMVENSVLRTIQSSTGIFENLFASTLSRNAEIIKGAFATSLKELGIQEDLGKLKEASSDLKSVTSDLKSMFEVKSSRAKFGELQLENLLKDVFPPQRLKFRENIGNGIPDACVLVEENRFLCIDSKFPLENFKKFCESEKAEEKEKFWNMFINDVKKHVDAIKSKYVGKDNTISRSAEEIRKKIDGLGIYLEGLGDKLDTLVKHISNASSNVPKVQQAFNSLKAFYSSLVSLRDPEGAK